MTTHSNPGRHAYGPRYHRVSPRTQARYIAESIQAHAAQGVRKRVHEYTACPQTQQLVRALLGQAPTQEE
jgi:hypothetical protein